MPELSGRDLLGEWRRLMDSVMASATSVGGRAEIPRALLEPMQKQVELLQEVIERERRLQLSSATEKCRSMAIEKCRSGW